MLPPVSYVACVSRAAVSSARLAVWTAVPGPARPGPLTGTCLWPLAAPDRDRRPAEPCPPVAGDDDAAAEGGDLS